LTRLRRQRGVNPNLARTDGVAPLFSVVQTGGQLHEPSAAARTRFAKTSYLELMEALLGRRRSAHSGTSGTGVR
jgi:hypothetical protein